jgi:hypothetical protein
MHLSPANLFDSMYVDGDYLQAVYRPYGTTLHGHSTTESVFWNTYGTSRCGSRLIQSRQWKWGYVIGTSGPVNNVQLGTQDNTAPEDFLEGEGQGETLAPQSLYLDQFYRRRGMDLDFSGIVDFGDFGTFAGYWMNDCGSPDLCNGCDFDGNGVVDAGDLAVFVAYWLERAIVPPPAPGQASNPNPADGAARVSVNADLSWTRGAYAASHDVYFGTSSPGTYQGRHAGTTFDPGTLALNTTYYWRIDEINASGNTVGEVWRFTTFWRP